MVTAAPMLNMALITSLALIDILSANSATLIDSGIDTSRTIGWVGFWKACLPLPVWLPPRRPPRRCSARFTFLPPPPRLRSSRSPRSSSSRRPLAFAAVFFGGAVRRSERPSFGGAGGMSSPDGVSSICRLGTSRAGVTGAFSAFGLASAGFLAAASFLLAASSAALAAWAFCAAAFSSATRASFTLRSASASAISPTNWRGPV